MARTSVIAAHGFFHISHRFPASFLHRWTCYHRSRFARGCTSLRLSHVPMMGLKIHIRVCSEHLAHGNVVYRSVPYNRSMQVCTTCIDVDCVKWIKIGSRLLNIVFVITRRKLLDGTKQFSFGPMYTSTVHVTIRFGLRHVSIWIIWWFRAFFLIQ